MKILIVYATSGAGHRRAAESVAEGFRKVDPAVETKLVDFNSYASEFMVKCFVDVYFRMTALIPEVWGLFFRLTNNLPTLKQLKVQSLFYRLNASKFIDAIIKEEADAVVCTHPIPLHILGDEARTNPLLKNLYAVVTDYGMHNSWITAGVKAYFVPIEEEKRQLDRALKTICPSTKVYTTGLPISPNYEIRKSKPPLTDITDLNRLVIMVMSGGWAVTPIDAAVESFAEYKDKVYLIVLTGKSEQKRAEMEQLMKEKGITGQAVGFTPIMEQLMETAEIIVTKTGGLVTTECLAKGKPIGIIQPIPGQEEANANYLLENGAGIKIDKMEDCAGKVFEVYNDPVRWERLKNCASTLRKPGASEVIAGKVLAGKLL